MEGGAVSRVKDRKTFSDRALSTWGMLTAHPGNGAGEMPNNRLQRTVLRAAAEPER